MEDDHHTGLVYQILFSLFFKNAYNKLVFIYLTFFICHFLAGCFQKFPLYFCKKIRRARLKLIKIKQFFSVFAFGMATLGQVYRITTQELKATGFSACNVQ